MTFLFVLVELLFSCPVLGRILSSSQLCFRFFFFVRVSTMVCFSGAADKLMVLMIKINCSRYVGYSVSAVAVVVTGTTLNKLGQAPN